jgi:hypothetical protein
MKDVATALQFSCCVPVNVFMKGNKPFFVLLKMPVVLYINGFRFFFYSNENDEPVHIHVEKAEDAAKFWLNPIKLEYNFGFTSRELKQIEILVEKNRLLFIQKWNEYFTK